MKKRFTRKTPKTPSLEEILRYISMQNQDNDQENVRRINPMRASPSGFSNAYTLGKKNNPNNFETLSDKEQNELEKAMLESEFVAEAVEGFSNASDFSKIKNYAEEINEAISGKTIATNRRTFYYAAAVISLLIVTSLVYYLCNNLNKSSEIAFEQSKVNDSMTSKSNDIVVSDEKIPVQQQENERAKKDDIYEQKKSAETTFNINIPNTTSGEDSQLRKEYDNALTGDNLQNHIGTNAPTQGLDLELFQSESEIQENNDKKTSELSIGDEGDNASGRKVEAREKKYNNALTARRYSENKAKNDYFSPGNNDRRAHQHASEQDQNNSLWQKAMHAFNKKECTKALDYFLRVLNKDSNNKEVYYYIGRCYYETSQWDKAIINLNRLQQNDNHYSEARWYMALSYINKAEKVSAEAELNYLIRTDSKYKEQAAELLKSLNK